jgi:hypothetical protein
MYEVAIHADPERFLDWDAPLSKQPHVAAALKNAPQGVSKFDWLKARSDAEWLDPLTENQAGGVAAYRKLSDVVGGDEKLSPALREAGIPGIRYLDQGSRTAGNGSRNYVVFDDKLVEILKKYGLGGLAIGGLGGLGGMPQMSPRT